MKPVVVYYATREGQTQRIAGRFAADLQKRGVQAIVRSVKDRDPFEPDAWSGAVLAASVHAGTHEAEMIRFVRKNRAKLESIPAFFLSVSLSEAGAEMPSKTPAERAACVRDAERMIRAFLDATGWHPGQTKAVAGALLYSRYNPLLRFVMKRIARKAGAPTDTSRDYEYTDWADLDLFAGEVSRRILPPGGGEAPTHG